MKLQLNERTLNAYINEAIHQELSEALNEARYKVDFDKMGKPKGMSSAEWAIRRKGGKFVGGTKVGDAVLGKTQRRMNHLAQGDYGGAWNNFWGQSKKHIIATLRELGYSDEEISQGLLNGAIQAGRYNGGFKPLKDRKNRKKLRKTAKKDDEIKKLYKAGWKEKKKNKRKKRREEDVPEDTTAVTGPVAPPDTIESDEPMGPPKPENLDTITQNQGGGKTGLVRNPEPTYPWDKEITPEMIQAAKNKQYQAKQARIRAQKEAQRQAVRQKTQSTQARQQATQQKRQPVQAPELPKMQFNAPNLALPPESQSQIIRREPSKTPAQRAIMQMAQTATSGTLPKYVTSRNKGIEKSANRTLNQSVRDGDLSRSQARDQKRNIRQTRKNIEGQI